MNAISSTPVTADTYFETPVTFRVSGRCATHWLGTSGYAERGVTAHSAAEALELAIANTDMRGGHGTYWSVVEYRGEQIIPRPSTNEDLPF